MAIVQTALGPIDLGAPTSVGTTGFEDIDALIQARQPEALGLVRQGSAEALRLAQLAAQQPQQALSPYAGLEAFQEQQALLGLSGQAAQQQAIAGIPVSPFEQEVQRRQRETLLRQAVAGGDLSGATIQSAQQLSGEQQLSNIQGRLSQLEPLAAAARGIRTTLSQQAEAARNREAQLLSARGTQLANIRLGVAAPQVSSIQQRAELSGLSGIAKAQQEGQLMESLSGAFGRIAPALGSFMTPTPTINYSAPMSGISGFTGQTPTPSLSPSIYNPSGFSMVA